jgi:hypothetical protein
MALDLAHLRRLPAPARRELVEALQKPLGLNYDAVACADKVIDHARRS